MFTLKITRIAKATQIKALIQWKIKTDSTTSKDNGEDNDKNKDGVYKCNHNDQFYDDNNMNNCNKGNYYGYNCIYNEQRDYDDSHAYGMTQFTGHAILSKLSLKLKVDI